MNKYFDRWMLLLVCSCLPLVAARAQEAPERVQIYNLLQAGKLTEALAAARAWAMTQPESPEALLVLASVQEANGDMEGALDSLDSAYFLTRDVNILVRQGHVYLEAGLLDLAEKRFQEALRQHEQCVGAHIGLARVLLERRQFLEAQAALQAALEIEPHSIEALLANAQLCLANGEPRAAEVALQSILQFAPQTAKAYLLLGQIWAERGDLTQARQHWRKFCELDPAAPTRWLLTHNLFPIRWRPFECNGYYPAFAPNGKLLAFRGRGEAGSLYISPLENCSLQQRCYQGTGTIFSLEWSPNSQYLLCREYLRTRGQNDKEVAKYRLILVDVAAAQAGNGAAARVLHEDNYIGAPAWLPDSQSILFDGLLAGSGRVLLRLAIPASEADKIPEPQLAVKPLPGEYFAGCLTYAHAPMPPEGSLPKLLVQRWHATSHEYQLILMEPADRKKDRILGRSAQNFYYPNVTLDGRYLFYYRRVGQTRSWTLVVQPLWAENTAAYVLPLRTLSPMPPAITADGKQLVIWQDRQGLMIADLVGLQE